MINNKLILILILFLLIPTANSYTDTNLFLKEKIIIGDWDTFIKVYDYEYKVVCYGFNNADGVAMQCFKEKDLLEK